MQQLIISIVIMYLVVGAAGFWYRRNQTQTETQTLSPATENERRS
jgi:hypothetical protein